MTRPHIYCLGPLVLDRVLDIDRLPGPDDKVFVQRKREAAGGPPRNVAAALAAWGQAVSLASVIGDDAVGTALLGQLSDSGIGSDAIEIVPDLVTATTLILVDANGERAILIDPITEAALALIGRDLTAGAGDVVLANLFHARQVAQVFARARMAGALTVLDLEWPEIQRWGWPAARAAIALADIVTTNSQVMRAFAEVNGIEPGMAAARALIDDLQPPGGRMCVTLGAEGVLARAGKTLFRLTALPVRPRDTTGAGDRFLAGLLHALLDKASFETALRKAVAAAGLFLAGRPHDWPSVEAAARLLTADRIETETGAP